MQTKRYRSLPNSALTAGQDKRRTVFLEPSWRLHFTWNHMMGSPPSGYEFAVAPSTSEMLFKAASRWTMAYRLLNAVDGVIPAVLVKSWLDRRRKVPSGAALTYAHGHLIFRPEPWVVEVEYASLLLGPHPKHLRRFQGALERMLASPYCKKILCWSEAGRRTVLSGLNSERFQHKVEVFPHAVPPKRLAKEYEAGKVKLLFVGSGKIMGHFVEKGGREVLETFALLRQRYDNLELVIRSDMPPEDKARASSMEGVRIMDSVIPWEVLEQEFQSADIFILPSHSTPPFTILDAMSYELPLVSTKAWANGELVEDGKTGLLVEPSKKVPYYYGNTCHPNYGTAQFNEAIRVPDLEVVDGLAKRVSLLLENPELRRRLGRAGRYEVEAGKFSLAIQNQKLKRIFDDATAGDGGSAAGR